MAKTFLPPEEIEAKVQEFLQEYHPDNTLPIPIEEIIDLKMGIHCPVFSRVGVFQQF